MNIKSELTAYTIAGENKFLKKELAVYVLLAVVLSWPVVLIIVGQLPVDFQSVDVRAVEAAAGSWPMLFGLGPFIAACITTLLYRGKSGLRDLFKKVITWRVGLIWYLLALVLPVIPQWIGLIVWKNQTQGVITIPSLTAYLSSWLQITVVATLYYISEELGWRGFMLPRLLSMQAWLKASLTLGVIWSIWHYPLWITSTWATTGSLLDTSLMVTANTFFATAISVVVTWIFKNTNGSILLAMLFHGSSQANLTKMYSMTGDVALLDASFTVTQAVTWVVFAILIVLVLRVTAQRVTSA